jgi:hypothetical protein
LGKLGSNYYDVMERPQLTTERLNLEFTSWTLKYGDSNNDLNLRFSQYIDFKYEHKVHEYLDDPFYYESTLKTYEILLESLRLQNIKNTL